jgi:hypothetical protein
VNLALGRQARDSAFPIIPVLLPGADPVLGFLSQYTWVDLRSRPDDPVLISILADAIARKAPGVNGQEHIERTVAAICPFRGLLSFRKENAPFFSGRAADTEQLMNTVERDTFVAVVGASGCGNLRWFVPVSCRSCGVVADRFGKSSPSSLVIGR